MHTKVVLQKNEKLLFKTQLNFCIVMLTRKNVMCTGWCRANIHHAHFSKLISFNVNARCTVIIIYVNTSQSKSWTKCSWIARRMHSIIHPHLKLKTKSWCFARHKFRILPALHLIRNVISARLAPTERDNNSQILESFQSTAHMPT